MLERADSTTAAGIDAGLDARTVLPDAPATGPPRVGGFARALIVLALVVAGAAPWALAKAPAGVDAAEIDTYLRQQMAANRIPGLAVAITHDDQVVYLAGLGRTGDGRAMTPKTPMRVGSLSKSFTAMAVLQLVERGVVDLDAPVRTYLPQFTTADADAGERITVRDLLNQTSGLADSGFPAYTLPQPNTAAERIDGLRDADVVAEPGTRFHYFNPNYEVLAGLVEAVTGHGFGDYLRRHIFAPLAMTDTVTTPRAQDATTVAPDLANGHIVVYGIPIGRDELDGYLSGSGGVISTAADLANALIVQTQGGHFDGRRVLRSSSNTLLHTPPSRLDSPYAMGWMVDESTDPTVLRHNGILSTFYAEQVLHPDSGYGIVVLANSYHALADYAGLTNGLMARVTHAEQPDAGQPLRTVAVTLAAGTVLSVVLRGRAMRRSRGWAARRSGRSAWRIVPGLAWPLLPLALLALLPRLVATFADRVLSAWMLTLAMPDVATWLAISGAVGVALTIARGAALRHHRGARRSEPRGDVAGTANRQVRRPARQP